MSKKPAQPTIVNQPLNMQIEAAKAKWWRKSRKLSVGQLADLTGYAVQVIYLMEQGINSRGEPIAPWVWCRYRMACAGVELYLQTCRTGEAKQWNWGRGE